MQRSAGFLLTRQARDLENTTELVFWVKTQAKPAKLVVRGEKPVFFVSQKDCSAAISCLTENHILFTVKALSLHDFNHQTVSAFYFTTAKSAMLAATFLKNNQIDPLESDIRLADRYLMERFIHGAIEFVGQAREFPTYIEYQNVKIKAADPKTFNELNFSSQFLSKVSLDIECSEKGELYSIGLASKMNNVVIMIGEEQLHEPCDNNDNLTNIQWVKNESALLDELNQWFIRYDPDIIVGWSVIDFDFRLLQKRAFLHKKTLKLGRGNENLYFREGNNRQGFVTIAGRVVLDGIDALKTATYSFSSWALDAVSNELLGEGKAIDNVYDRMASINRMFANDKLALAKYNLQDCVLVNRIFEHCHLIEFLIERTKLTGIELDRVGGSVAAFTNLYLPKLHRAGFIAPTLMSQNWIASPGGYVMQSIPGLYDSVLVLDFKSLYPSIIRSFLIDPMGLIEGLHCHKANKKEANQLTVEGFREAIFHREKHFLPQMIKELWQARDRAKKQGEKAFSQAIKIIMNSFYGVLGSSGCRFFDHRLASSITMRGHEIMKTTRTLIEANGMEVIYGDTDSTFVSLGKACTNAQADKIGKKLVKEINQFWKKKLADEFQLESYLEIEYETHYKKFLMPTIRGQETGSKKRYAGLIDKNNQQEIIFKGLEAIRTDWTVLAQEFQQQLYQKIFAGVEIDDYIRQVVEDTEQGRNHEKLIYRKRLRRKLNEYQRNVPPHVKAARKADEYNQKNARPLQYQAGGWIEYVITLNGPEPVEAQFSPIDHQHYIEKQLKPIADAILPFIGKDFTKLTLPQIGLW